jgi:Na+/melibiose symporter-like transporter
MKEIERLLANIASTILRDTEKIKDYLLTILIFTLLLYVFATIINFQMYYKTEDRLKEIKQMIIEIKENQNDR